MSTYRKTEDFDFPSFETQTENQTLSQPYNNPYLSKPISCLILLASLVVFSLVFLALKCLKKLCNHQNTNSIDPLHIDIEMGHQRMNRVDITQSSSAQIFNMDVQFWAIWAAQGKRENFSILLKYSCNNITTTLIQISRLSYFSFFSKTNHQMMI